MSSPSTAEQNAGTDGRFKRAWAGWPGSVARTAVALLPMWWLYRNVDLAGVRRHGAEVGLDTVALSYAVAFWAPVIAAFRWALLQRTYGAVRTARITTLLRHYLVGFYYNSLPGGLAGDVLRGHRVREHLPSATASYTVVVLERTSGLAGLLVIAVVAMGLGRDPNTRDAVLALLVGAVAVFGVGMTLVGVPRASRNYPKFKEILLRVPVAGPILARIPPPESSAGLLLAVFYGFCIQLLPVAVVYILGQRLTEAATLPACARAVPLVMLFTAIPLTPLGLGQREMLFVFFLAPAGITAEQAVTISILVFAILLGNTAVGGLLHLIERLAGWEKKEGRGEKVDQGV